MNLTKNFLKKTVEYMFTFGQLENDQMSLTEIPKDHAITSGFKKTQSQE